MTSMIIRKFHSYHFDNSLHIVFITVNSTTIDSNNYYQFTNLLNELFMPWNYRSILLVDKLFSSTMEGQRSSSMHLILCY